MIETTQNVQIIPEKNDSTLLKIAFILLVGGLAPLFDTTMVNVAINTLTACLQTTVSDIQWVITGYLLAMSMTIPVSVWAVNQYGGKRMWLFSLILFLSGSICSALSWNVTSLIISRFIQGIGAGLIFPIMMTLIAQAADGQGLGRAMSILSVPALFAPIFGPVLGGIIMNAVNWQWIFIINIPICIIAILLAWKKIPPDEIQGKSHPLDIIGILLFSPALALLVYAISRAGSCGCFFDGTVVIPLGISLFMLGGFIIHATTTKKIPILDIRLFKSQFFSASCTLLFLSGILSTGAMLLLPLYFQQVRGDSVLYAGLWLIPQGLGMLLTRGWVGELSERAESRILIQASLLIIIIGTLPFSFSGPDTPPLILAVALFIRGIGLGGVMIPAMVTAYQGLVRDQIPHVSSATRIFQQIGGAFGSAVIAVIVQQQLLVHSTSGVTGIINAYDVTFWWLTGFAVIAMVSAFFLPLSKRNDPRMSDETLGVN